MRSLAPRRALFTPSLLSLFLAAILVASLGMISLSGPAKASQETSDDDGFSALAGPELLPNGDFTGGTNGWRTNGPQEQLSLLPRTTDPVAQLTASSTSNATLNDAPNVVDSTIQGTSYVATARVRTTTPEVHGALRIREVSGGQASSSETSFRLTGTEWQTVQLTVTTTLAQSHLDLNLVAWSLPAGDNLQVDWISLKELDAPAPQPPPGPPAPQPPPNQCDVTPSTDTTFGSTASTVDRSLPEALQDIDSAFGPVPIIRHFSTGLPFAWDSRPAQQLQGRDLVVSFKVHPNQITSGQLDSFFRNWFATAPADQTIYWSYYHEPENNINAGEFTAAQYRAAWARLGQIYDAACRPNMFSTLILTEWTMNPGSGRDYRTYDAGPQAVDIIAFDPYNGIHDAGRDYYVSPEDLMDHIVEQMDQDGRPWAIAEVGSRIVIGDNGTGRAAWLSDIADYAVDHDAVFVTYFHAEGVGGDYRLHDAPSRAAWRQAVQS